MVHSPPPSLAARSPSAALLGWLCTVIRGTLGSLELVVSIALGEEAPLELFVALVVSDIPPPQSSTISSSFLVTFTFNSTVAFTPGVLTSTKGVAKNGGHRERGSQQGSAFASSDGTPGRKQACLGLIIEELQDVEEAGSDNTALCH